MKKRFLTAALAAALILSVGTTSAFAHGCAQGRGWRYADADGDGICDNAGTCVHVDSDGDGICDYGCGSGFVDADGDGVCDNAASGACPRAGAGYGRGCGRGRSW